MSSREWLKTAWCLGVFVNWLSACSTAPLPTPGPPIPGDNGVRFTYVNGEARSVAVAGAFNGWSVRRHPMEQVGENGLWTVTIPLDSGEHAFMYVVNGQEWVTPPMADDYVPDGFGLQNGLVVVP